MAHSGLRPDNTTATPNGYKISHHDRPNKAGGGIAIIYKQGIDCTTTTDDTTPIMEHLNFKIQTDAKSTNKGSLPYRPPGPRPTFCSTIPNIIAPLATDTNDYIFLRDLIFHLGDPSDNNTSNLLESMSNISLKQLVNRPTHRADTH